MSTLTIRRSSSDSVRAACATRLERFLLAAGAMLTSIAEARMERRATHGAAVSSVIRDDARRDAAATVHIGLLPR